MEVAGRSDIPKARGKGRTNELAEQRLLPRELSDFSEVVVAHTVQVATASLSDATPLRLGMNSWANTPVYPLLAMYSAMPR